MKQLYCAFVLVIATWTFGWMTSSGAQAQTLIAVIGDSNVAGKGVSSSENYPTKLERALKAKGYDVRVVNLGITGDTTSGVLSRLDSVPQGTRVAIVWVGVNDRRRGVPEATIQGNHQEIARQLRARGIAVLVLTGAASGSDLRLKP